MKKAFLIMTVLAALVVVSVIPALAFENVTPEKAYELVTTSTNVYILDVRTAEEWTWVGHPGSNKLGEGALLTGKVFNIPYLVNNEKILLPNSSFLKEIKEITEDIPDVIFITMCRSGKRSVAAATVLEEAGYRVLNMVTGFEGGKDAKGYRVVNGWVNAGLPYNYSSGAYTD